MGPNPINLCGLGILGFRVCRYAWVPAGACSLSSEEERQGLEVAGLVVDMGIVGSRVCNSGPESRIYCDRGILATSNMETFPGLTTKSSFLGRLPARLGAETAINNVLGSRSSARCTTYPSPPDQF